jgi:hypothetical protein
LAEIGQNAAQVFERKADEIGLRHWRNVRHTAAEARLKASDQTVRADRCGDGESLTRGARGGIMIG